MPSSASNVSNNDQTKLFAERLFSARAGHSSSVNAGFGSLQAPPEIKSDNPERHAERECRAKLRKRGIVSSQTPCVDIDELLKELSTGTYTFNKPSLVYEEQPFNIILVLQTSPSQTIEQFTKGTQGKLETVTAQFAGELEVTLKGVDFKVEPSAPQRLTVTSLTPAHWEWSVVPLSAGEKILVIEVTAILALGMERHRVQMRVLRETIDVKVSKLKFVKAMFADAVSGALALIAAAATFIGIVSGWGPTKTTVRGFLRRFSFGNK